MSERLARFRVDPAKVRVSIRRCDARGWRATVESRSPAPGMRLSSFSTVRDDVNKALDEVLGRAAIAPIDEKVAA